MRLLLGIVGSAVLVVAGLVSYLNVSAADVVVVNAGQQSIRVRGAMPGGAEALLAAAGVRNLPDELKPGVPTIVRVPALSGQVDVAPGSISVSLLGQSMAFAATCDNLSLDGASLIGRQTAFSLGGRPRHDLQLACR